MDIPVNFIVSLFPFLNKGDVEFALVIGAVLIFGKAIVSIVEYIINWYWFTQEARDDEYIRKAQKVPKE